MLRSMAEGRRWTGGGSPAGIVSVTDDRVRQTGAEELNR